MNITIHRGASQIGGCITEISTDVARIIIDLGSNLPGCQQADFTETEIARIVNGADAVLYTHYHGDHVGFISMVPETVRQYIGVGAQDVMRCKLAALNRTGEHQKDVDAVERMLNYEADKPLNFCDLRVTPYYCSHSAFDAYMFKIEWNGKVILHTGDFRKHGYMGNKLIPMLKKYVGQVDVLITEGTMLGRKDETVKTEYDIQKATKDILTRHKYVFALGSSTDIDRLASFHAACKATKRHFYVDKYQQSILGVFTKYTSSPLYDFSNSNGYKGTTFGLWEFCHINKESVVKEMQRRGFLMPVRSSGEYLVKAMLDVYTDEEPILLYSMWDGYWKGTEEQRIPGVEVIRSLFKPENIIPMHTSGHADICSLTEVCRTVNPKLAVIPIHKEKDSDFSSLPITEEQKSKVITSNVTIEGINICIR